MSQVKILYLKRMETIGNFLNSIFRIILIGMMQLRESSFMRDGIAAFINERVRTMHNRLQAFIDGKGKMTGYQLEVLIAIAYIIKLIMVMQPSVNVFCWGKDFGVPLICKPSYTPDTSPPSRLNGLGLSTPSAKQRLVLFYPRKSSQGIDDLATPCRQSLFSLSFRGLKFFSLVLYCVEVCCFIFSCFVYFCFVPPKKTNQIKILSSIPLRVNKSCSFS